MSVVGDAENLHASDCTFDSSSSFRISVLNILEMRSSVIWSRNYCEYSLIYRFSLAIS